jgi:hypothetical protein
MPNPTVRASATALPNSSRRFFLGRGAAALSGVAIGATIGASIPLPSAAAQSEADAELFALADAIAEADRAHVAAIDRLGASDTAFFAARPPTPVTSDAVEAWEQECERLKKECGQAAAEVAERENSAAVMEIADVIAETPATTLAGLIFKARYAAEHYGDSYDQEVMISIVDDLLEMELDRVTA